MIYPYLPSFYGVTSPAQIVTPLVYDESISYEQQIAMIFGKMKEVSEAIAGYLTITAFTQFVEALDKEEKNQTDELKKYTNDLTNALKIYVDNAIRDVSIGAIEVLDPSTGEVMSVENAISNSYNDLRYWALSWNDIDTYTENKTYNEFDAILDDFTVREIDLFASIVLLDDFDPH